MRLKRFLMVSVLGTSLLFGSPSYAFETAAYVGWQFFQDVVSMAVGFLVREWNRHTETIHYDVTDGLEKIKENIGMYQDQGICGVSATGATGCDLVSEEEGAEMTAEEEEEMSIIPESTIELIQKTEADGEITCNSEDVEESEYEKVRCQTGSTFDKVRSNVALYMFETDDETVNADCKCTNGTGKACSTSECAQNRQNDALVVASTAASGAADAYLRDMDERYTKLSDFVDEINTSSTIAAYVGRMGYLSVYASSIAAEQMALQTYDLRAQSYRNLIFSGITKIDLPEEEDK